MNKKLLAVAVGMALGTGPMLAAQADVSAYGKFNVGIASVDNGNTTDSSTLGVTDDSSRLGVQGDEDLGGGLKAIYQMEFTYDADGATGAAGPGRDVFVGLQGGWGSVRAGQYSSSYKAVEYPAELLHDSIADFTTNGWSGEGRIANAITYRSPNFNGLNFGIDSSRGETGTATESNPTTLGVTYKGGPLYVGVGYASADNTGTTGLDKAQKLVARYDISAFSVIFAMESQSNKGTISAANAEVDTTVLGGAYKFGNTSVIVTLSQADSTTAQADCDQTSLGVEHVLSKSTKVRGVYSSIDNETAATCQGRMISGAGLGLAAPAAGSDPSGFQFMVVKSF